MSAVQIQWRGRNGGARRLRDDASSWRITAIRASASTRRGFATERRPITARVQPRDVDWHRTRNTDVTRTRSVSTARNVTCGLAPARDARQSRCVASKLAKLRSQPGRVPLIQKMSGRVLRLVICLHVSRSRPGSVYSGGAAARRYARLCASFRRPAGDLSAALLPPKSRLARAALWLLALRFARRPLRVPAGKPGRHPCRPPGLSRRAIQARLFFVVPAPIRPRPVRCCSPRPPSVPPLRPRACRVRSEACPARLRCVRLPPSPRAVAAAHATAREIRLLAAAQSASRADRPKTAIIAEKKKVTKKKEVFKPRSFLDRMPPPPPGPAKSGPPNLPRSSLSPLLRVSPPIGGARPTREKRKKHRKVLPAVLYLSRRRLTGLAGRYAVQITAPCQLTTDGGVTAAIAVKSAVEKPITSPTFAKGVAIAEDGITSPDPLLNKLG